jgi:hypothetical protein
LVTEETSSIEENLDGFLKIKRLMTRIGPRGTCLDSPQVLTYIKPWVPVIKVETHLHTENPSFDFKHLC